MRTATNTHVQNWEQVRKLGREVKLKFDAIKEKLEDAKRATVQAQLHARDAMNALEEHLTTHPQPNEFPTNAELAQWDNKREKLTEALAQARQRFDQAAQSESSIRMDALTIAQEFDHLQYSERNTRMKVTGEL